MLEQMVQGEHACVQEAGRQSVLLRFPFGCEADSFPACKTNLLLSLLQRWLNDAEHILLPKRRSRLV